MKERITVKETITRVHNIEVEVPEDKEAEFYALYDQLYDGVTMVKDIGSVEEIVGMIKDEFNDSEVEVGAWEMPEFELD